MRRRTLGRSLGHSSPAVPPPSNSTRTDHQTVLRLLAVGVVSDRPLSYRGGVLIPDPYGRLFDGGAVELPCRIRHMISGHGTTPQRRTFSRSPVRANKPARSQPGVLPVMKAGEDRLDGTAPPARPQHLH